MIDLEIVRGADYAVQMYWTSPDQQPFTVLSPMRMEIKDSVGNVLHTLATNEDGLGGGITYNSSTGLIQLEISAVDTKTFVPGQYEYDLFVTYQDNAVTNATRIARLIRGNVFVERNVTDNV